MPAGTSLAVTDDAARAIEQRILAWPETRVVSTRVGGAGVTMSGTGDARTARFDVELVPRRERARGVAEVAALARTLGGDVPGASVSASVADFLGFAGQKPIAVRVQGEDPKVLQALATRTADVVRRVPGTTDVSDGGATGQPELVVSVDRRRAADLGLTPAQVAGVLRTGLAGSTVGAFRPEGTKGWDLTVILDPAERARTEQVQDVPIVTPGGQTVRLGQVATFRSVDGPTHVDRRDGQRVVTVGADLTGARALGDVTADIAAGLAALDVPAGYTVAQGGEAEEQAESFGKIFAALGLSLLLMYLLMALLYESLLTPLIIMLSLPLAMVGAFGLLAATGSTLNIMSMIGLILLTGLVGKNAILLVDYTNHLRKAGLPRDEALLRAGPTRLRPILMTTVALVLAMLPIALRLGEGSEWRAPMAVTVIGGLLTSTVLTLLVIPAVYSLADDLQVFAASLPGRARNLAPATGQPRRVRPAALPVLAGGAE
jgi:HAE1 family hydrophobic/amphiphilic exporter-1